MSYNLMLSINEAIKDHFEAEGADRGQVTPVDVIEALGGLLRGYTQQFIPMHAPLVDKFTLGLVAEFKGRADGEAGGGPLEPTGVRPATEAEIAAMEAARKKTDEAFGRSPALGPEESD